MANERQGQVVTEARAAARQLDESLNDLEGVQARYDVLNLETPNFATGFFGTTQEITANDHLGIYTALNTLKSAGGGSAWLALRAALRKARS